MSEHDSERSSLTNGQLCAATAEVLRAYSYRVSLVKFCRFLRVAGDELVCESENEHRSVIYFSERIRHEFESFVEQARHIAFDQDFGGLVESAAGDGDGQIDQLASLHIELQTVLHAGFSSILSSLCVP